MNRLNHVVSSARSSEVDLRTLSPRRAEALANTPLSLFNPLHYERNYAYPLFVWLHGTDEDERQLPRLMPYVSMRNYVGVAPRGTIGVSSPGGGRRRHRWPHGPQHVSAAAARIADSIRAARERFNIAPRRIFLAGADEGGTLALRVALAQPNLFAGVISAGGLLPTGGAPLARLNAARRLPVFLAWRQDSDDCTRGRVCANLRLLHAAGFDVALRLYAGEGAGDAAPVSDPKGDTVTRLVLADMDRWMMELVTGGRTAAEGAASNQIGRQGDFAR